MRLDPGMLAYGVSANFMNKDFDSWNELKKKLQDREIRFHPRKRDIWWCSLGANIGSEQDGKHELFERPVLIIKVFNRDMVRILPLTSRIKDDHNHVSIIYRSRIQSAILSHVMTVSTKRLWKTDHRIDREQFRLIVEKLRLSFE